MVWKPAKIVFKGGSDEAQKLSGKLARLNHELSSVPFGSKDGMNISFKAGMIGLIGHVPEDRKDLVTIAFPNDQKSIPRNLNDLAKQGTFHVLRVNWPTFQERFEIDV